MENIYRATELVGEAYGKFIADASPEVRTWLVHKLKHTFGVAHDIMDIFQNEKAIYELFSPQERRMVEIAGILHDLGRFYQHKDGKNLSNKVFDHGAEAVKMLQDMPYFGDKRLLFAIYEHNRREINYKNPLYVALPDKEKQQAAIMAKLLRDADKLENIKCFAYYGIDRLGKAPDGVLSEPIKQDLLNKQTIDYSNIKTATDGLAMILSWNNDIYYATTVKRLKEIDFINLGIEAVSQHGSSNEDLELLRENIFYHTVGD